MASSRFWLHIYIRYGAFFLERLSREETDLLALLITTLDDIYDAFSSINFIIITENVFYQFQLVIRKIVLMAVRIF